MEEKNFLGLEGLKYFWTKIEAKVIKIIEDEIAQIIANAPEDLDTLKEIADWISTHEDSASAMNTAILSNTEAISGKADKIHTHTKSEITDFPTSLKNPNALTVNGKTYDGSTAVDAGVQTVANGGTGATTALGAFESLANGLPEGAGPLDTEHIIFQNENRKNWGLYTLSQFWEYIKSKISSVLGLTKDSYGGTATKANNGFNSSTVTDSTPGWGYLTSGNGYSNGRTYGFANGGGIATAEKDTKSSLQIDGDLYVHEGLDKVATLNDIPTSLPANGGNADTATYAASAGSVNSVAWGNVTGKPAYITGSYSNGVLNLYTN